MDNVDSNKPVKTLFLEHHADIIGGGQLSLLGLMTTLDYNRYLPLCVCPADGSMAAAVRDKGIDLLISSQPFVQPKNSMKMLAGILQLYKLLRYHNVGLIHANGSRAMFYAGLATLFTGIPAVWHVRVPESDGWLDRFLAILATRIIVISKAVEARFYFLSPEKKIVVHNGVDISMFKPGYGQVLRASWGDKSWVGMVAQLIPWKHYDDFIMAMVNVAPRFKKTGFLAIGEDPDPVGQHQKDLRALVHQMGLEERFNFTGFLPDIPAVMDALDIVVLCSDNEGFGRVLIEAMAAAKPVVATDSGGIPEIVVHGETGFLVPVRDVDAISEAVIYLLGHPEQAQAMGLAGRRRVEAMFTMEAHARAVETVFDEVLKS